MTEYMELDSISSSWTYENNKKKGPLTDPELYCIHCSTPFQTNCFNQNEEENDSRNFYTNKFSEISSSSSSKVPLSQVLSTIFKLNYLKAFKTRRRRTTTTFTMKEQRHDDENLSLCLQCGQVLSQLYELYNDFNQLGKLDSYLSHMLTELDQIMDKYQDVSCDLKERLSINKVEDDDDDQSCQDFFSDESIPLDNKNNYCSTTTTTTISNTNFDREPRVLLTRLPEKYLNLLPTASSYPPEEEEETIFYDNDDEGDEYDIFSDSVTIKTEYDNDSMDLNVTTGDDDGTSSSSTQNYLKNNKQKSPPNISIHISSTTTTTTTTDDEEEEAAGIRKSKRIRSRHKAADPLDQKSETEDRKRNRTKNSRSSVHTSKQTKKSKNSQVTRLECTQCSRSFAFQSYLTKHIQMFHSTERSFQCDQCPYKAKTMCNLKVHKVNMHSLTPRAQYRCAKCGKIFKSKGSHDFHRSTYHNPERYQKWLQTRKIKRQQKKSDGTPPLTKNSRSSVHTSKQTKKSKNSQVTRLECTQCSRSFAFQSYLTKHIQMFHSTERSFQCDQCPYKAKTMCNLKVHTVNMHSLTPMAKYRCAECDKIFQRKSSYNFHRSTYHNPERYQKWLEAEKKKRQQKKLGGTPPLTKKSRSSVHTSKQAKKPKKISQVTRHQCTQCSRSFPFQSYLTKHIQMFHSTERSFQCDQCPYKAKTICNLKAHKVNIHTRTTGAEYPCGECEKIFKSKSSRYAHRISYHNPERYRKWLEAKKKRRQQKKKPDRTPPLTVCADCGFMDFTNRLAYINHRLTVHSDYMGRNFVCDQCGSAFRMAYQLRQHIFRHTGERPFLCQKCGKAFKFKGSLDRHDINTHTVEGRLKNNAQVRAGIRRMKLRAMQLAKFKEQQGSRVMDPGMSSETATGSNDDDQLQ